MGVVYLAEHTVYGRKEAVKFLSAGHDPNRDDLLRRFVREAKAVARIEHENVIQVHSFGHLLTGQVFLVMEYLEGQTLGQLIRAEAPFSLERILHLMGQICRALDAAHSKQVIHRDLKPANIFVLHKAGQPDFVKVLDFGIAKIIDPAEGEKSLTRGSLIGTPGYMAPEQIGGEEPDGRADIYALGSILYEMLTGAVPFPGSNPRQILTRQLIEQPIPPSRSCDRSIPAGIEAVCLRALEREHERRFQSMKEFLQALEQAARETPFWRPSRRRHRSYLMGLAGGALALLLGAFALRSFRPPVPSPPSQPLPSVNPPQDRTPDLALPEKAPPRQITWTFAVTPANARIRVDDRIVQAPLKLPADGQVHRIQIDAPGYQGVTNQVAAEDNQSFVYRLARRNERPPPAAPPPKRPSLDTVLPGKL